MKNSLTTLLNDAEFLHHGHNISEFAKTFGSTCAEIIPASGLVTYTVNSELQFKSFLTPPERSPEMLTYLSSFREIDPLAPSACLPLGQRVVRLQDALDPQSLAHSKYKMLFLDRFMIEDAMEIFICSGLGITIGCSLLRHRGWPPFGAQEMAVAQALCPLAELTLSKMVPACVLSDDILRQRFPIITPSECRVMRLLALGLNNKQLAENLGISLPTVKSHILNIFRKLDVSSRSELTSKMLL